jgi:hypothetical protein
MKNAALSIDDLDAVKASTEAFEFEYINAAGEPTGVFLSVLGAQSEKVTSEIAKLVNARRKKEAAREVQRRVGVGSKTVEFETVESDVEFGQRLAAVRMAGWRGVGQTTGLDDDQLGRFRPISEPFTPENALKLCRINREIATQVTLQSDTMANFMKG